MNVTEAQAETLRRNAVDVGESQADYLLDQILVFSNRFAPADAPQVPYLINRDGTTRNLGYRWSGTHYLTYTHTVDGGTATGEMPLYANIHGHINAVTAKARRMAPHTADAALDTCCDPVDEPVGPIQRKAFDMIAYGFVLNAIADIPAARKAWGYAV